MVCYPRRHESSSVLM